MVTYQDLDAISDRIESAKSPEEKSRLRQFLALQIGSCPQYQERVAWAKIMLEAGNSPNANR